MPTILVVDDEENLLVLYTMELQAEGYEVLLPLPAKKRSHY
jgi:DNA-binding response OmpR family regulator